MALRLAAVCCCVAGVIATQCTCCEKKDDWKIDAETRPGERGAGFLYKRAKSSAVWSKRYHVITDTKMIYYVERDRMTMKGEIVLAGATASASSTRADVKKKYYFLVSHPQCGVREFYAKTKNRRDQWVSRLNDIASSLDCKAVYGKLHKQGGLGKNLWQERWCICAGGSIDYFDSATDNQCKGSINIINAVINPITVKGKNCFEVTASIPGKKGNKKYVFSADKEHERDNWVEVLKKASKPVFLAPVGEDGLPADSTNPLHNNGAAATGATTGTGSADEDSSSPAASSLLERATSTATVTPTELAGYLQKKSPAVMKGWQKRYFRTLENGDIVYHKTEEDSLNPGAEAKGMISMKDILPTNGVECNESNFEIIIKLQTKKVYLKAKDLDEAVEWTQNILAWVNTVNNR